MALTARVYVTATLDTETAAQLEHEAREKKMRVTPLIRDIIRQHLAERQHQSGNGGQSQS